MKNLFSLFLALLCVNCMFAEEVLNTDFTQGKDDWVINDVTLDGVTYVWQQNSSYGMKASAFYQSANHVSESWLISPALSLSNADTVSLYIQHALNFGSSLNLAVKAKADLDDDWTDLNVVWPQGNSWTFITSTSDISSAFAHKTGVQIAFVYVSDANSAPTWEIKNVVVTAKKRSDEPEQQDPIEMESCSAAAAAAKSVSGNNVPYNNGALYTVVGFVTAIAADYNATNGCMTFWMADDMRDGQVLEAYKVEPESADKVPEVGDVVQVTGKLTKFNNIPEFAVGCTCKLIKKSTPAGNLGEKTIAEFLELKNAKDTCILTGIVRNIVMDTKDSSLPNKFGNFDLVELGNDEVSVYIYGLLTADGKAEQFQTMGIEEGDTLKLKATYNKYNGKVEVRNAVFVAVKKTPANDPTGLDALTSRRATKYIRDGVLFIEKNGIKYNVLGAAVR